MKTRIRNKEMLVSAIDSLRYTASHCENKKEEILEGINELLKWIEQTYGIEFSDHFNRYEDNDYIVHENIIKEIREFEGN